MKNPITSHANPQTPTLTPELSRFIESMGVYFEDQGVPRIGGRILALLMIAHEPLKAEDIAALLKVSRGSISTNFRILLAGGLAEKIAFHGDRTTYYVFPEAAWEPLIAAAIQQTIAFKRVIEQGLAALPASDTVQQRLGEMMRWSDFLIEFYNKTIAEWRARQQSRPANH
ncbi:MAG TPA: ArsR family transcriptional regulator [Anaerolineales bacterium]|jgi:DNA-binding transcriptional regulator GbsR (MarR family)|nr:ArsR family transcriptional regulator [Anaerolineales bacterium]